MQKKGDDFEILEGHNGIKDISYKLKLYRFRSLTTNEELYRIQKIIDDGFYCSDILNFNDMNEGVYRRNKNNKDITLLEKMGYKICSFSEKEALSSELMWGHYANAGKGIAIEIEISKEDKKYFKKVEYDDNKKELNTIEDILTNKSKAWSYEKEWRYLKETDDNPIKMGKITRIYFGTPYQSLDNYTEIQSIHKNLQKYHNLKKLLKKYCEDNSPTIVFEDYLFSGKEENSKHEDRPMRALKSVAKYDYTT